MANQLVLHFHAIKWMKGYHYGFREPHPDYMLLLHMHWSSSILPLEPTTVPTPNVVPRPCFTPVPHDG